MSANFDPTTLPTAQKRTSQHKKFVYVADDFVYKGPYRSTDKSYLTGKKNLNLLKLLQFALKIPEDQQTHLDIVDEFVANDGSIFVKFPNVGKPIAVVPEMVSSKIDTNVPVMPRDSFVSRASDLEAKCGKLPDQLAKQMLQHLYLLYILGIGDVGSHNILIRADTEAIVGIDLEEDRGGMPPKDLFEALFGVKRAGIGRRLYAPLVTKRCFSTFSCDLDSETQVLLRTAGGNVGAIQSKVIHFINISVWTENKSITNTHRHEGCTTTAIYQSSATVSLTLD